MEATVTKFQWTVLGLLAAIGVSLFCLIGVAGVYLTRQPNKSAPPPISTTSNELNNIDTPTPTPLPTETPRPTNTPRPTPTPKPLLWDGYGDEVSTVTFGSSGSVIVSASGNGDSNFIVAVYDLNGNMIGLPVNCIAPCSGTNVVVIRQPGQHLIEITSDGQWEIKVTRP